MLFVLQELVQNDTYSDLDVAVWCFISADVFGPNKKRGYISAASIAAQMYEGSEVSPRLKSKILGSIEYLLETGLLIGKQYDKQLYEIDIQSFSVTDRYFNTVEMDDLYRILKQPYQPFSVLRQYLLIISAINYHTKCGIWSLDRFGEFMHKDSKTISKYIKVLEDIKLIYVYREGGMGHISNTYGRYEDAELVKKVGKERGQYKQNNDASNQKRRMTQMYNQIKKGKKYDDYLMKEIYNYCSAYNEHEHELQEQNPKYVPNLFDLSVIDLTSQS